MIGLSIEREPMKSRCSCSVHPWQHSNAAALLHGGASAYVTTPIDADALGATEDR